MGMENFTQKTLDEKIEEMYVVLKSIQMRQEEELKIIQKNHATNMKKISKLQEFNQISDMTNQIFELRIAGIEQGIKQLNAALIEANKRKKQSQSTFSFVYNFKKLKKMIKYDIK